MHLCGEPAAEKLIRSLVKSTGDELEVCPRLFQNFLSSLIQVMYQLISACLVAKLPYCYNFISSVPLVVKECNDFRKIGASSMKMFLKLPNTQFSVLQVRRYKRLTPLHLQKKSLGKSKFALQLCLLEAPKISKRNLSCQKLKVWTAHVSDKTLS